MFTTPLLRARVLRPSQLFVRFANTNGQFLDHISQRKLVRVVHEDDHFLFINKPGNITIAGDVNGVNLHDAVRRYATDNRWATHPQLVHRLDRPVSGLMLYPKSQTANKHVRRLMLEHSYMLKEYVAIVIGTPEKESGTVKGGIFKHQKNKKRYCIYESGGGKSVETRYKVLKTIPSETFGSLTALALRLTTGRTHQLRATCAHLQTPILGDQLYGGKKYAEVMLHAARINFQASFIDTEYNLSLPPPWINPLSPPSLSDPTKPKSKNKNKNNQAKENESRHLHLAEVNDDPELWAEWGETSNSNSNSSIYSQGSSLKSQESSRRKSKLRQKEQKYMDYLDQAEEFSDDFDDDDDDFSEIQLPRSSRPGSRKHSRVIELDSESLATTGEGGSESEQVLSLGLEYKHLKRLKDADKEALAELIDHVKNAYIHG